jgi:PEGA domain
MRSGSRKPSTFFSDDDRKVRPIYKSARLLNGAEEMRRHRRLHERPSPDHGLLERVDVRSVATRLAGNAAERISLARPRIAALLGAASRQVLAQPILRLALAQPRRAFAVAGAVAIVMAGFSFLPRTEAPNLVDGSVARATEPALLESAGSPPARKHSNEAVAATMGREKSRTAAAAGRVSAGELREIVAAAPTTNAVRSASSAVNARATRQAASQPVGTLVVNSEPAGASVSINGVPQGLTPVTVPKVRAGSRVVRVDLPGYQTWSWAVPVVANQHTPLRIKLQPEPLRDRK